MPPASKGLALFLLLPCSLAFARDLPATLVRTKDDLFLKGNPKFMRLDDSNYAMERKFNKDGVMTSQMVGGTSSEVSHEVEVKKHKLVEIRFSPSKHGNGFSTRPLQTDDEGRVTALREANTPMPSASSMSLDIAPSQSEIYGQTAATYVRIIRYEPGRQVHDIYRDRVRQFSTAFEFSEADRLLRAHCVGGDCGKESDFRYGEFGPTQVDNVAFAVTYTYENGVLVDETSLYKKSGEVSHIYYGNYEFDACGNWTRRYQYNKPASDTARQPVGGTMRKFDYYTPCAGK